MAIDLKDPESTIDKLAEWAWKNGGSIVARDILSNETGDVVASIVAIFLPGLNLHDANQSAYASALGGWLQAKLTDINLPPPDGPPPAAIITLDFLKSDGVVTVLIASKAPMVKLIVKQAFGEELPTSIVANPGPNRFVRRREEARDRSRKWGSEVPRGQRKRTWNREVAPGTKRGRGQA